MQLLFKSQVNRIEIDNFRNLAYVDLLVDVDLKNKWLVELIDVKYKSSSNFKSIGWKLRILEIPPTVSCWPLAYVDLLVDVGLKNN